LNVIAASVLMGLSLSAVAGVSTEKPKGKEAVVTPAPVKSLAEAVKGVKTTDVSFATGDSGSNPSQVDHLDKLLQYISPLDFSNSTNRSNATKSVKYAHGQLFEAYSAAKGEEAKATALQHLVAFNRAAALQMVKNDTAALTNVMESQGSAISQARNKISQEQQGLSAADSKAKVAYNEAISDFLKLSSEEQSKGQNTLMETLTKTGGPLKSGTGYGDIHLGDGGFKTYDELVKEANTAPASNILASHKNLIDQQNTLKNELGKVTPLRENLAKSMTNLANSMPFYTPEEQDGTGGARETYLNALTAIGKASTSADSQSKAGDAGQVTHILGSLTSSELTTPDPLTGEYNSVIVNTDGDGNVTGV
ncbi:hypothetical protein G7563_005161, partial [Salmonella enterica subsp. enterica]|nr:hypothetical protein [Salmonella enterica subsp. enterica serovar Hvittingfoss]